MGMTALLHDRSADSLSALGHELSHSIVNSRNLVIAKL